MRLPLLITLLGILAQSPVIAATNEKTDVAASEPISASTLYSEQRESPSASLGDLFTCAAATSSGWFGDPLLDWKNDRKEKSEKDIDAIPKTIAISIYLDKGIAGAP